MNSSKAAIVVSQIIEKIELIAGAAWGGLFALCILACIIEPEEEDSSFVIACIVCLAIGAWVFYRGYKRKKLRQTFKRYVACLSEIATGDLASLAAADNASVDVVKKNLREMIKKRFFANAVLDEANNLLILNSASKAPQVTPVNVAQQVVNTVQNQAPVYVTCNCPNCGGINKIAKGMIAECDFCGSTIQG